VRPAPARAGDGIDAIDTPALVIDRDAMQRNIALMAGYAHEHGLRLRPHAKTHKSAHIAELQKMSMPQLIEEVAKQGGSEVLVVVGGVIPAQDYDFLKKAGVAAIYGPGTNIPAAAAEILSILRQRNQKRAA